MKGLFTSRKFRQGTVATAITVVVVALVVVINFLATALTDRYSLTLDLTPSGLFSITDETKEYLKSLDKDVEIIVMSPEETFTSGGDYYLQAIEVLKKYALESSRISITYEDLVANPALSQQYPDIQLSSTSILITCGDRVRDVTPSQLYDVQTDYYSGSSQVVASKAEQVLTSTILAVTSDDVTNIAILTGHSEDNVAAVQSLLKTNNYMVEEVSILTGDLDSAFDVAFIVAPQVDYNQEELQRLDRFLKNEGKYGKTIFYFASGEQPALPNLDAFLADWGIRVGDGIVYETDAQKYMPNDQFMAVVDYADAEGTYSGDLAAKQLVPLTAYSRPLELLFESKSGITTQTLLQFAATAGVATAETTQPEAGGTAIPHMVMAQHLSYDGTTPMTSQVVACGSAALINSQFLAIPNLSNSEYILGLIADLSGREDIITIQSKDISATNLGLNQLQALLLGIVLAVILPLVLLVYGLVVWGRRRHR